MSEKKAALLVAAVAGLVLTGAAILPSSNIQPYGEATILKRIAQQDSDLCARFRFPAASQEFAQCMAELADVRQRHEQLLIAYEQF
jgi:hypothetical protein